MAAGRLFPFIGITERDVRNYNVCKCNNEVKKLIPFHIVFPSLPFSFPGAGFAAYRFQVCSKFIIAQFSAFVNDPSIDPLKKVLDKVRHVCYNINEEHTV